MHHGQVGETGISRMGAANFVDPAGQNRRPGWRVMVGEVDYQPPRPRLGAGQYPSHALDTPLCDVIRAAPRRCSLWRSSHNRKGAPVPPPGLDGPPTTAFEPRFVRKRHTPTVGIDACLVVRLAK